jgi:phosphinothricin acetyltransferase
MIVRPATLDDAFAIAAIYGHHVLHGAGTFEEAPPSPSDIAARMKGVLDAGFPWLVVEEDDEDDEKLRRIVAYGYAAPYHRRSAYRYTVEDSVYVADGERGKGYGRAVLAAVIDACETLGLRRIVAVIGDSQNEGSIALHRALGFAFCGTLPAVGFKAGQWLDVVFMQLPLNGGDQSPPD